MRGSSSACCASAIAARSIGNAVGALTRLRFSAGLFRFGINLWPPFVGAGIHVTELSSDFRRATVRLRHGLLNRNYFGTHYGGSLFSMTDPFYAILLLHNLPRGYMVWDKASSIEFKVPGRGDVFARFALRDEQVVATVAKTLYIRRKRASDQVAKD